jgi:hypothetical protein
VKKPDAFARKRKTRDKANLRWVKSRHLVIPAMWLFVFVGTVIGATIGEAAGVDILAAAILSAFITLAVGGPYIVKSLTQ